MHSAVLQTVTPAAAAAREVLRPQPLLQYDGGGLPDYTEPVRDQFELESATRLSGWQFLCITGLSAALNGSSLSHCSLTAGSRKAQLYMPRTALASGPGPVMPPQWQQERDQSASCLLYML
jgi:hypothetical protein